MNALVEKISLFFGDKSKHRLGAIELDAVIKESHELKAQVTEHPAESGESFCDHVAGLPTTIQLEGIISNTPMTFIGITAFRSLANILSEQSNDLAQQAFTKLEEIFAKREPIIIATSLKDYDNMVLESLSVERGEGSSQSLHFRASAKQIRIAQQATIEISVRPEPKTERAKPKEHLGKQETKPASEEIKKSSFFSSLTGWGK